MKKILSLVIACGFLLSVSNAYVDIGNEHYAYNDIIELKNKDIALGYPDNTFKPDNYITEEELVTILLRASNLDACDSFSNWPNDYVELAMNNGIVVDGSLVTRLEFNNFIEKISVLQSIIKLDTNFKNLLNNKNIEMKDISKFVTRAEACKYINQLIKNDGEITTKELPQESDIYFLSDESLNVSTIINSIEVFEYDSYNGKYLDKINLLKSKNHPYLKGRDKNAQGNYIVAVEFDTKNNSNYGVWTSYNSLKFENMEVIDAFDFDEIDSQLMNLAYNSVLIKPNEEYSVIAFYIVEEVPNKLIINRDITTLYDLQTHKYVDANSFSKIEILL